MGGTFVGFGFGAIQGGLFLPRHSPPKILTALVVAEIDTELVAQIRRSGGRYHCNIAESESLRTVEVSGVEVFNPLVDGRSGCFVGGNCGSERVMHRLAKLQAL